MSYKQQFFLALSVGIAFLGLLAGELWLIHGGRARFALALEDLAALASERKALDATRSLAERTVRDRAALHARFIQSDGLVAFLKRLEGLGKHAETALSVETLSADSTSFDAPFEEVTLRFTATGEFRNIAYLLALVGSLPTAVTITSARLETAPAGEGDASLWRATVFLRALKARGAGK